jgi:hypothetical protein
MFSCLGQPRSLGFGQVRNLCSAGRLVPIALQSLHWICGNVANSSVATNLMQFDGRAGMEHVTWWICCILTLGQRAASPWQFQAPPCKAMHMQSLVKYWTSTTP